MPALLFYGSFAVCIRKNDPKYEKRRNPLG